MPGLEPGSGVQAEDATNPGSNRQAGTKKPHQKRRCTANGHTGRYFEQ